LSLPGLAILGPTAFTLFHSEVAFRARGRYALCVIAATIVERYAAAATPDPQGASDGDFIWKLVTFLVAVAAVLIGWRQYSISQDKLRLDLFEKRFKVFDATRTVLADYIHGETPTWARLQSFAWETADAQFLFGPEVVGYLDEVYRRLSRLQAAYKVETAAAEVEALTLWIVEQRDVLPRVMGPYLRFSDVRRRT
jgi:hypothetical protein